jgi:hypothetical protein
MPSKNTVIVFPLIVTCIALLLHTYKTPFTILHMRIKAMLSFLHFGPFKIGIQLLYRDDKLMLVKKNRTIPVCYRPWRSIGL